MISELPPASERRVYVGLAWDDTHAPQPAGLLKLLRQGVVESGEFAYGRRYLARPDACALHPDQLPLRADAFPLPPRRLRDGGALPLTLRDALPDSWGRRVLEARQGRAVDDIEALLLTNADRVGAMVFSQSLPLEPCEPPATVHDLDALAAASRQLEEGAAITPALRELLGGGSLGGARPKATFFHGGNRHIAKFASRADDCDMELVEAATLDLAAACGIHVAGHLLQPLARGHALLVRRFDRQGGVGAERRLHFLSCSAVLDVPYASSDGSYVAFAQALRRLSARPGDDLVELFRRMVFNLAVGNSDDHVKNHGMLFDREGSARLAPAFDLVPQFGGFAGYQELAILPGRRDASLALALEAAPHFGLRPAKAGDIVDRTLGIVAEGARQAVEARGGDTALALRLQDFIARRHQAIRA